EVFPDNRALLNFRGANVVAESLNVAFQKGDIINVRVEDIADKVVLRIFPPMQPESARGAVTPAPLSFQISTLLRELNLPVNEQNLLIGEKLLQFEMPLTR